MKATILQNDLNKWVGVVSRVVPGRVQVPVLSNILIEADKEGLFLTTTNLEIGLRISVGGKVEEEGAITVPAKNFGEFIGSLPAGNVQISSDGEKVKVAGGNLSATFSGISAAEFPVVARLDTVKAENKPIKLKREIIEEIAREVAFCAATDESRPVLTGIMFLTQGKTLKVTATDGFRLSRKTCGLEEEVELMEKGMIIPARTIIEASKILAEGKKEYLEMAVVKGNNQVILAYGGVEMTSRVLEGNFPDVDKIIPTSSQTEAVVDREEMLRAIRAAGIFARDSSNVVKMLVSEGKIDVQSNASQSGESKTVVEAAVKGGEVKISFNYRYVLKYLGSVAAERIVLRMNDGMAARMFGTEGDEDSLHLIMPVRV